jgi:hypothetical protein
MPLVREYYDALTYKFADHVAERCEERGIGVFEVFSAIADATFDRVSIEDPERQEFYRGDIKVVVHRPSRTIVTAIDLDADYRSKPRRPLAPNNPPTPRGESMARRSSTTPLDEAWCLVAHSEPDIRRVLVSPALAEKILALNPEHNRPLNRALVDQYKEEIASGTWLVTHQGVALDTTPHLQDGQHRLTAIAESGESQEMFIAVGMDPANFKVIDTGRNRKYSDVLAMRGMTDTFATGATVRLAYIYLHRNFTSTHKVTNAMVLDLLESDVDAFRDAMTVGRRVASQALIPRVAAGAANFLIRRVNTKRDTQEFFDLIINGAGDDGQKLRADHPAERLRYTVNKGRADGKRRTGPEHLALIIKAWNAYSEGRELKMLVWGKQEPMPRVTRIERHK